MEPVKIVARFLDGRIIKGYTQDFFPNKPIFHLHKDARGSFGESMDMKVAELKAVFFVRSFEGNPDYRERTMFEDGDKPSGRKVEVMFKDGEVMQGSTLGYDSRRPGFFLFPPDPQSNNLRVFVVNEAVRDFRYL